MIDITQKLSYNKILISIVAVALVCSLSGCKILKNEGERQVRQEVKEYLDENFDSYASKYSQKKIAIYKERFQWTIGSTATIIGLLSGIGGLSILRKKLKVNNEQQSKGSGQSKT